VLFSPQIYCQAFRFLAFFTNSFKNLTLVIQTKQVEIYQKTSFEKVHEGIMKDYYCMQQHFPVFYLGIVKNLGIIWQLFEFVNNEEMSF